MGSWALVWAQITVLFPHMQTLLPHLGEPEGIDVGELPTALSLQRCQASLQRSRDEVSAGSAAILPHGAKPEVSLEWSAFGQSRQKLQKEFSTISHAADFLRTYEGAGSPAVKARLLSVSERGAQAHWSAIPQFHKFVMDSGQTAAALSLQLGIPQPSLRGVRRCVCNENIDPLGHHYLICNRRGWTVKVHHKLRDTVAAMLKTVFEPGSVSTEPWNHYEYSPRHRPDVVVRNHDGRGNYMIIDTYVAFPCCATYARQASWVRLHAAHEHEKNKWRDYGDCGLNTVVPFAMETFGALGAEATKLLNRCSEIRNNRLGSEEAEATWSTRTFTTFWRQRIAVALQVDIARGIETRAQLDWRP